jgi:hypothetical protein
MAGIKLLEGGVDTGFKKASDRVVVHDPSAWLALDLSTSGLASHCLLAAGWPTAAHPVADGLSLAARCWLAHRCSPSGRRPLTGCSLLVGPPLLTQWPTASHCLLAAGWPTAAHPVADGSRRASAAMYQVKGVSSSNLVLRQVKMSRSAMNSGDVFILDTSDIIFQARAHPEPETSP